MLWGKVQSTRDERFSVGLREPWRLLVRSVSLRLRVGFMVLVLGWGLAGVERERPHKGMEHCTMLSGRRSVLPRKSSVTYPGRVSTVIPYGRVLG